MSKQQAAYTLLEVMLVLAMTAILALVAVPTMTAFIERHQEAILQAQLLRTIQSARQEAFIRGVPVSICKSKNHITCGGEWSDGLLTFVDEQGNGIVQDTQYRIAVTQVNMHRGKLYWRAYPYYRDYLRFVPVMAISADNGLFWYCRTTSGLPTFALAVSHSGSSHVILPDKNGMIKDSRGRVIRC